jgi:hypothetical protein
MNRREILVRRWTGFSWLMMGCSSDDESSDSIEAGSFLISYVTVFKENFAEWSS